MEHLQEFMDYVSEYNSNNKNKKIAVKVTRNGFYIELKLISHPLKYSCSFMTYFESLKDVISNPFFARLKIAEKTINDEINTKISKGEINESLVN